MKVLDHEPHFWFLLEDAGSLFLDANCSHSFVGYDFLVQLTPGETQEYHGTGRSYLSWLAQDIQDTAPILTASREGVTISPPESIDTKKILPFPG